MAEKKVVLTKEGLANLEDELQNLKVVRRKEVAEKIKEARAQGDLSENAEYDAAKDEQAEIEGRIATIENLLRNAEIVESNTNSNIINVGTKVKLYDVEFEEEVIYTIVGSTESNPMLGKISNESPLGHALIGKTVGDTVNVNAPEGLIVYKVLEIL